MSKGRWEGHKGSCRAKLSLVWYDRYRKCKDRSQHEGKLKLMTWPLAKEELGWGGCLAEESDDLKQKFKTEYSGDKAWFYKYWPQGFRWTCCSTDAGMKWGCDHHGMGSKPCTCDFCRWVQVFFLSPPRANSYNSFKDRKATTQQHLQGMKPDPTWPQAFLWS